MSTPVRKLYDKTSLALRMQVATGYSFPPIIPLKTIVKVPAIDKNGHVKTIVKVPAIDKNGHVVDVSLQQEVNKGLQQLGSTYWQVPVKFRLDEEAEGFLLPLDPFVSVSGKNIIKRRYVSKSDKRGSIKERWSQDDYEITISGVLIEEDSELLEEYLQTMRRYCEAKESVHITCDLLNNVFDIYRISIETYNLPFTKGVENQTFSIKAYSDDLYSLLEEI